MCVIFLFRHFASLAYVYYKMPKKKKNKKVPQTEQEEIIDAAESEALTHSLIPPSDTNLTTFLNHEKLSNTYTNILAFLFPWIWYTSGPATSSAFNEAMATPLRQSLYLIPGTPPNWGTARPSHRRPKQFLLSAPKHSSKW